MTEKLTVHDASGVIGTIDMPDFWQDAETSSEDLNKAFGEEVGAAVLSRARQLYMDGAVNLGNERIAALHINPPRE